MAFDEQAATRRHRERRERLQGIRNEFTDIVNDYYDNIPESEQEERALEYRIEERLIYINRQMERFINDFRRYPNS